MLKVVVDAAHHTPRGLAQEKSCSCAESNPVVREIKTCIPVAKEAGLELHLLLRLADHHQHQHHVDED